MKKWVKWQGIAHMIYSLMMVVYAGIHTTFASFWTITGLFLMLISGIGGMPGKILSGLVALTDVAFACQIAQIFSFGQKKPDDGADYVIILGAQVKGKRPSRALLRRIRAAVVYMEANPTCKAVACGGRGRGELITECECICETLISLGIDRERILCENRSVSTLENFMFTKEMIGDQASVVIASNSFHLYRAVEIAKRVGFSHCQGIGTAPEPMLELNYYVRESISLWYNRLRRL